MAVVDQRPLLLADRAELWPEGAHLTGAQRTVDALLVVLCALDRQPDLEFAPLCLGHLSLDQCIELGKILANLILDLGEPVGIVASSDMSHYLTDEEARRLDNYAIDAALTRDPATLYETVHDEGITMCGVVPATVALEAANRLGAADAHLVAYATSGDVSGDRSAVVGYAGICIHR